MKRAEKETTPPDATNKQAVIEYLKQILKSCEDEYNHLYQTFQSLDSKANATGGISGILLAAAFAYANQFTATTNIFSKNSFTAIIIFLLLSMLSSLLSMWVKSISSKLSSKGLFEIFTNIKKEITENRIKDMYSDKIKYWITAIEDFKKTLIQKAIWLKIAQFLLFAALFLFAILTYSILY